MTEILKCQLCGLPGLPHASQADCIFALQAEIQQRQSMLDEPLRDLLVRDLRLHSEAGQGDLEMFIQHPFFGIFALQFTDFFVQHGAKNYLEVRFWADGLGFITLTFQREAGKSPHQLRKEAELELDRLASSLMPPAEYEKWRASHACFNP